MSARTAAAAILIVAGAAGCGTPSADLFVVTRSGAIPAARLTLLVSDDGSVTCNGGPRRPLTSGQLIAARRLARDLDVHAQRGLSLPRGPRSILTYRVRAAEGTVRFSDTSPRQPRVFFEVALFTRQVAQRVCGLPR